MMGFDEMADGLRVDETEVRVCDVADLILGCMEVLDTAPEFESMRRACGEGYGLLLYQVAVTLLTNLIGLSKGGNEMMKAARSLASSDGGEVIVAELERKDQA